MAIKGLSVPFFGKYSASGSTVTYSEGKTIGHAISYQIDPETSEDNPLYGDNKVIEHDKGRFQRGTLTLGTSELTDTVSKWLLGLSEGTVSVGSGQDAVSVTTYSYDDDAAPITVGFGIIELHQIDDTDTYKTVILPKCVPNIPSGSANTKGASVEWQTPEITFAVERSDAEKHPWKIEAWHTSETDAIAYLQAQLGYSAG